MIMVSHNDATTNSSRHSNDITTENIPSEVDTWSTKEKYQAEVVETQGGLNDDEEYPDGGLKAWLVVVGVCRLLISIITSLH